MIENILIIDTETTGLSPEKGNEIIEIAAVIFNVKYKTVLQCFSTLLPCQSNPVENINHIKSESTQCEYAFKDDRSIIIRESHETEKQITVIYEEKLNFNRMLMELANFCQICVAHNAEFDMKFIKKLPCGSTLLDKKWICTKKDFKWPVPLDRNRLQDICIAMGVPYLNAHRALADCFLLAQCFEKVEDLQERIDSC